MRGDDALALADVRALVTLALAWMSRLKQWASPGRIGRFQLARWRHISNSWTRCPSSGTIRSGEHGSEPTRWLPSRGEGRQARIAALIRDLDHVAARQWSQPVGVFLGESPIVKNLIAEGDAAVEPLIRDFRFDDRLTCSVGFGRSFFRHGRILRADQAAYTALTGILKTSNFAPPDPNEDVHKPISREALANQIQAYRERNRRNASR
jgi:hypothetical protein